jgi:hypothetical protein
MAEDDAAAAAAGVGQVVKYHRSMTGCVFSAMKRVSSYHVLDIKILIESLHDTNAEYLINTWKDKTISGHLEGAVLDSERSARSWHKCSCLLSSKLAFNLRFWLPFQFLH